MDRCKCRGTDIKCRRINLLSALRRAGQDKPYTRIVRLDFRLNRVSYYMETWYLIRKIFPDALLVDLTHTKFQCKSGTYSNIVLYTDCDIPTIGDGVLSTINPIFARDQQTTDSSLTTLVAGTGPVNLTMIVVGSYQEKDEKTKKIMMFVLIPVLGILVLIGISLVIDKVRRNKNKKKREVVMNRLPSILIPPGFEDVDQEEAELIPGISR